MSPRILFQLTCSAWLLPCRVPQNACRFCIAEASQCSFRAANDIVGRPHADDGVGEFQQGQMGTELPLEAVAQLAESGDPLGFPPFPGRFA